MVAPLKVVNVGAGMFTLDSLLPTELHLKRKGILEDIVVTATRAKNLKVLHDSDRLKEAFPDQSWSPFPSFDSLDKDPEFYKKAIDKLDPYNLVVVAVPDDKHFEIIKFALEYNQHVIAVKPLVLKHQDGEELRKLAEERGLFLGVDYHKRPDKRNLLARSQFYKEAGTLIGGHSELIEPSSYLKSGFQEWFHEDITDPFTYIGCHYTDLITFITGLLPIEVSVKGFLDSFPNGAKGYIHTQALVTYQGGGKVTMENGLISPEQGPGSNAQGLVLRGKKNDQFWYLKQDDQNRGVEWVLPEAIDGRHTIQPNPQFYILEDYAGPGKRPSGYGYDSIFQMVEAIQTVNDSYDPNEEYNHPTNIKKRNDCLRMLMDSPIALATNTAYNDLTVEAGRRSLLEGRPMKIEYNPARVIATKV